MLVFIAFCGFAYGAIALFALGTGWSPEFEKHEQIQEQAQGLPSRLFDAISSFLTLPVREPLYALCIAVLMAVPSLVF